MLGENVRTRKGTGQGKKRTGKGQDKGIMKGKVTVMGKEKDKGIRKGSKKEEKTGNGNK